MGWCNKPTKLQFQSSLTQQILMLSNDTNQPKSTVELGYMCSRGLSGPPAVTTHQVVEILKETSTKMNTPFYIGLN